MNEDQPISDPNWKVAGRGYPLRDEVWHCNWCNRHHTNACPDKWIGTPIAMINCPDTCTRHRATEK